MKRLLLTALILIALPFTVVFAQDNSFTAFGGVRFVEAVESDQIVTLGISKTVGTSPIKVLAYTDIGTYGSMAFEMSWWKSYTFIDFGLLAGPNVQWDAAEETDAITYLGGASGLIAHKSFGEVGIWGAWKYRFTDGVQDGTVWGIGLSLKL